MSASMDSTSELKLEARIEKLGENNFHSWKQKVELVLMQKEVDNMIDATARPARPKDPTLLTKWLRKDKLARATIGLCLSDEMLKNVRHTTTALEMWTEICDVHQKHTLLNKLSARRDFYTATMSPGEKMLSYINRVRQLASTLESMQVEIDEKELAMAVLNGLPSQYQPIITALDAIGDDDESFTFSKVRSRLLQEEKRIQIRTKSSTSATDSALVSQSGNQGRRRSRVVCMHCGRPGHTEPDCWDKYGKPSMNNRKERRSKSHKKTTKEAFAMTANAQPSENCEDEDYVCLSTRPAESHSEETNRRIAAKWHVDTGCTRHMTFDRDAFTSYTPLNPHPVEFADNSSVTAVGCGDVILQIKVGSVTKKCVIKDVLHVPTLVYSLLSTSTMARKGFRSIFDDEGVHIVRKDSGLLSATGSLINGLYLLDLANERSSIDRALLSSLQLWHERLGHVHKEGIKTMAKKGIVDGLQKSLADDHALVCEGCVKGKLARAPIPGESHTRSSKLLQLVHSDLAEFPSRSYGGAKYFVTFIDDFSRYLFVYVLKSKDECFETFKTFAARVENETGERIGTFRSDGGGEYISKEFNIYLRSKGIKHEESCAYTPEQNGVAERMNRTLKNLVRSMLIHKGVNKHFWAEALRTAAYVRNRVTSRSIASDTTPYQLWYGEKPDIGHLRIFGSYCWYKLPKQHITGLDSRANKAIFLGYAANKKAYKLWDPMELKVIVSRDVKFDECPSFISAKSTPDRNEDEIDEDISESYQPDVEHDATASHHEAMHTESRMASEEVNSDTEKIEESNSSDTSSTSKNAFTPRRSTRVKKLPSRWGHSTALATVIPENDLTFTSATKGEESESWKAAIESEYQSHKTNKSWILVPRSEAKNILTCRWVFKRKDQLSEKGTWYIRYKARLVARGFQQKHGIDYEETYAPVVAFSSLRMFFAICSSLGVEIDLMDVVTAFLNGDLIEKIYMEQPEGYISKSHPDHVCLLLKSIYGLKQASRQWNAKIHSFLVTDLGFKSAPNEPCLFILKTSTYIIIITLYVDDLLIASTSETAMAKLKSQLSEKFMMNDCGRAKRCIGLEIDNKPQMNTVFISQEHYTLKMLDRFGMTESKPVHTPMEQHISDDELQGEQIDATLYRSAIGSLMYLAVGTRPDISFAVCRLAQFCESPTTKLWIRVKRIMRYLRGTYKLGIRYMGDEELELIGYSDSDWAGCKLSRKSTSGNVFLMGSGAISWKTKKQTCVAASSSEAEYIALSTAVKEAIWLQGLYKSIVPHPGRFPILINVDNQGSIAMAKNVASGTRTKHIDIQYHFARDALARNLYAIEYIPTSKMLADIFTKPLQRQLFEKFRALLGMSDSMKADKL